MSYNRWDNWKNVVLAFISVRPPDRVRFFCVARQNYWRLLNHVITDIRLHWPEKLRVIHASLTANMTIYLVGSPMDPRWPTSLRNFFTLAGWGLNWIFMSNATRSAFRLLVMLPTEAQVSSGQSWEGIMSGCKCPGQVSMGKCPNTNTRTSLNWCGRLISLNSHDSRSIMKSMIGVLHTVISKQIIYSHLTKTNAEKFIREFALRCQNYPRLRTK